MRKYTLIGHPLGHSMSPFIHQRLFALSGIDASYSCTDIEPSALDSAAAGLKTLDGFNVTIPHKTNIIRHLDSLADSAKRYNSVNCVSTKDGISTGYNTDCDGFLRSVEDFPLSGKALLLGCGGVGRMMALEASAHHADLTIGIIEDAKPMADALKSEIFSAFPNASVNIKLIRDIDEPFDLILNATPVGMYPNSEACPVSENVIAKSSAVFDAIYNPVKTMLLATAQKHNLKTKGGMAMLVLQAVKAHEIWYGGSFSNEQIQALILDCEQKVEEDFK